ncbi:MAG: SDR family oxidoreductase [Gammaproteobacteria bacterium]
MLNASKWNLEGRSALVTGGTRGIGRAVVHQLSELGANVIFVARDPAAGKECQTLLREKGHRVRGIAADVSTRDGREALMGRVTDQFTHLDILVNNVGTNLRKPATSYSDEEISALFRTNLDTAFSLSRRCKPLLAAADTGAIVNIASVAGLTHICTGTPYAMTKAAMIQMTRSLAVEWAADSIRVNAIAPWYIDTPLAREVLEDEDYRQSVLDRTPMRRIGQADEVAAAAAFFCMPASSYVTGQCLAIDGGFSVCGLQVPGRP